MHEILTQLSSQAIVLDLGSGEGSVPAFRYSFCLVSGDAETPVVSPKVFVQLDAARLPFKTGVFDALILNHSLEHFRELDASLREIGRIIRREKGAVYIATPNAKTLADRLYRWIGGGGHVNHFTSLSELVALIERGAGLKHQGTRFLCSSFSILNARNLGPRRLGRVVRFLGGNEGLLAFITLILRRADRLLRTSASFYGWALYFGDLRLEVDEGPWTNVCVRCGAGHPSDWLESIGQVETGWLLRSYDCPTCGARNFFTSDKGFTFLRRKGR